jgi:hypothetical protein
MNAGGFLNDSHYEQENATKSLHNQSCVQKTWNEALKKMTSKHALYAAHVKRL